MITTDYQGVVTRIIIKLEARRSEVGKLEDTTPWL